MFVVRFSRSSLLFNFYFWCFFSFKPNRSYLNLHLLSKFYFLLCLLNFMLLIINIFYMKLKVTCPDYQIRISININLIKKIYKKKNWKENLQSMRSFPHSISLVTSYISIHHIHEKLKKWLLCNFVLTYFWRKTNLILN